MKYYEAKKYREELQSKVFKDNGVFFAFSNEQFNEKREKGIKYVSLGAGMILPKDNIDNFLNDNNELGSKFEALVNKECDAIEVIMNELENHEFCITYDFTDTKEALKKFNYTDEQYSIAKDKYLANCD